MLLLHLSDLHFGNKNRFAGDPPDTLSKAFYRALEASRRATQADSQISHVVITGDLVESGLPSEFRYALDFLRSLADQLDLRPERFVILPGNHDISWDDCQIVRAGLKGEKFAAHEFDARLAAEKLANYRSFLASFYGAPVTDDSLAGLPDSYPLDSGGWLRDFPEYRLSVAALNTSERENDQVKGGFLSAKQAQNLMTHWLKPEASDKLKIIALHHNPISTTPENVAWTLDWLRREEKQAGGSLTMSADVFERYVADLAGFEGREHLSKIVKDTAAHLILHGHHHDQGAPILWPWAKNGSAPILSVGSFGLSDEQLPGQAPLSCQLIRMDVPTTGKAPRLVATPLVYDGRFRLKGEVLDGAFRAEINSRAAYDQPLPLSRGWKTVRQTEASLNQDPRPKRARRDSIPLPPAFYAAPAYIGSHQFVGRQAQLEILNEWASPADTHPVLLFEAIGGTGKSILTWEWTTKHATTLRDDWAGCMWYSFYEKGATMGDFCRRALAYMAGRSLDKLRDRNTAELIEALARELRERPWLLILDGLERVLIAYHRFDAAQIPDEEAGTEDKIAHRDPCSAINPEDDDLLRALTSARPSKILLTSRLIPRALLNRSNQAIPGVLRERLPGLRPADAEALIRACGVTGKSTDIQNYLKVHCDCHPLVIGVLAGLINHYLPNRGNFDAWANDPRGGGQLTLAELDLVQKRNHILDTALAALPEKSRELLSTLALLSESVDYATLCALNPYIPAVPDETVVVNQNSVTDLRRLTDTVRDLELRGLLQYDSATKRHDLHPVVRGISAGGLKQEEKNQLGQRVIDHFSQQAQNPYEQAETLDDFNNARRIVKAMFHMGEFTRAREFINSAGFLGVMNVRFEAHSDILTIIKPFFAAGWTEMPRDLQNNGRRLITTAAVSLRRLGQLDDAFAVSEMSLRWTLAKRPEAISFRQLLDLASTVGDQHRFALEERLIRLASDLASVEERPTEVYAVRLATFRQLTRLGRWKDAESLWPVLAESGGVAELAIANHHRAINLLYRGSLTEEVLHEAEKLNDSAKSAIGRRNLCALRGWWLIDSASWEDAKKSLNDAIILAHKAGKLDKRSEIHLALARHQLGELSQPQGFAEQFSNTLDPSLHMPLARLWLATGEREQAMYHATAAYKRAQGDGEPYVHRYECTQLRMLFAQLGVESPAMRSFDAAQSEVLPWEREVARATKNLHSRKVILTRAKDVQTG